MAEDLTRKQGGERFSVLFPANLPTRPQKPDQLRILAIAIARGPRARRRGRGRPRVPRPLGSRRTRAERVRGSGARRDPADPGLAAMRQ